MARCRAAARALRPLPAHVLRRPAPAHRHRPRIDARSRDPGARRAGLRARRVDPGAGAEPARRSAGEAQSRLSLHQPRPLGGAHIADEVMVMYLGRAVEQGPARRHLRRSRSTPIRAPCCRPRRSPIHARKQGAHRAQGRTALAARPADSAAPSIRAARWPSSAARVERPLLAPAEAALSPATRSNPDVPSVRPVIRAKAA